MEKVEDTISLPHSPGCPMESTVPKCDPRMEPINVPIPAEIMVSRIGYALRREKNVQQSHKCVSIGKYSHHGRNTLETAIRKEQDLRSPAF